MSLQTIIDNATYLTINKRKGAGVTVSRSGHIKTSVQQGSLYRFTVGAPQGFKYSENRDLLQQLDDLDVTNESNVSIGRGKAGLNYLTAYQGDMTVNSSVANTHLLSGVTLNGYSGNELYVDLTGGSGDSGNVSSPTFVVKVGDFIQPEGNTKTYRYPYQVTSDLQYTGNTSASNITITVNRPILSQDGVSLTSGNLRIGFGCRYHLICANMPTYSVVPHDLIEFSDDFELIERLT